MSNFLCSNASAIQKNPISIKRDLCHLMVLFVMPTAVKLTECTGVGGCGYPISSSVSWKIVARLQLRNSAPSSASAAEATTKCKMHTRWKMAHLSWWVLWGQRTNPWRKGHLWKIWCVWEDIEDHVGGVKSYHHIWMHCQIVIELFGFQHGCGACQCGTKTIEK